MAHAQSDDASVAKCAAGAEVMDLSLTSRPAIGELVAFGLAENARMGYQQTGDK